jgi:hypothetical protein
MNGASHAEESQQLVAVDDRDVVRAHAEIIEATPSR